MFPSVNSAVTEFQRKDGTGERKSTILCGSDSLSTSINLEHATQ